MMTVRRDERSWRPAMLTARRDERSRHAADDDPGGARPIAIDARAAARPELGGVERWARELTTRLPVLRPGG
jgi:hypothetical protein